MQIGIVTKTFPDYIYFLMDLEVIPISINTLNNFSG